MNRFLPWHLRCFTDSHQPSEYFLILYVIGSTAAAAAKSLQSCPTLCDPIDGSPSGSPVPGILQARTLEWVAISFSNASTIRRQKMLFSLKVVSDALQPHGLQHARASLSITVSWSLLKLMPIELVLPYNHLRCWEKLRTGGEGDN